MSRIDDLLQRAIVTGAMPAEATEAERAELAELLSGVAAVRTVRRDVEAEANATMPIARARFERFMAAPQAPALSRPVVIATRARAGVLGRLFGAHRGLALSGAAVAIGVLAVVTLFGSQALLSNTETAAAQVLSPDDYVQVQGVVQSTSVNGDVRTVNLDSPLGTVQLTLSNETSVVDEQNALDAATIKPGDQLLVGGVAVNNHAITAHTIAISPQPKPAPQQVKLKALSKLVPNLEGRVSLLTISKDGTKARVLIDAANGERYVVNVDVAAAEELLRLSSTALGTQVRVNAGTDAAKAVFRLAVTSPAPASPSPDRSVTSVPTPAGSPANGGAKRPDASAAAGKTGFVTLRGVVTGRSGTLFQLETSEGVLTIQVRAEARRLVGDSGLTRADIGNPDAVIGHAVTVTGGLDPKTGRVIADVIVVGPKAR
jgi:hypothetical protein